MGFMVVERGGWVLRWLKGVGGFCGGKEFCGG